ncbi:MAG: hypothetical protein NT016_00685 [Candidatus Aenigmarchaeota archaeon]|nr:hypothetical protein [Candidatus Aenigmarchaeota archaeon]
MDRYQIRIFEENVSGVPETSYDPRRMMRDMERFHGKPMPANLLEHLYIDEAVLPYLLECKPAYATFDKNIVGIGMGVGRPKLTMATDPESGITDLKMELEHYETLLSADARGPHWLELASRMVEPLNELCTDSRKPVDVYTCALSYNFLRRFYGGRESMRTWRNRLPYDAPVLDENVRLISTNGTKKNNVPIEKKTYESCLKDWVGNLVRKKLWFGLEPEVVDEVLPEYVRKKLVDDGGFLDLKRIRAATAYKVKLIREELRNRTHEKEEDLADAMNIHGRHAHRLRRSD